MKPRNRILAPIFLASLLMTGWASAIAGEAKKPETDAGTTQANDPLSGLNRVTSGFNRILRQWIIDPVVDGYQAITPDEVQKAVSNAAANLTEPVTVGSSLLQGDTDNAATAAKRFIINSAAGIGGLNDVATDDGFAPRREDFGQALGAHGVGPGPHIVLPIIGPSNIRDAAGDLAVFFVNPLPVAASAAAAGVEYSGKQDAVNGIGDNSLDPYIAERDSYEQNRKFVINNGALVEIPIIAEMN